MAEIGSEKVEGFVKISLWKDQWSEARNTVKG